MASLFAQSACPAYVWTESLERGESDELDGRHNQAIVSLTEALASIKTKGSLDYPGVVKKAAAARTYEDLDELLDRSNDWMYALVLRGTAYGSLRLGKEALNDFDASLMIRPDNPQALCNRGVVLMALNRLDHALNDFERAIKKDPFLLEAHLNRAKVYKRMGRPAQWRSEMNTVNQLQRKKTKEGGLPLYPGRNHYELRLLKGALKLNPQSVPLLVMRGDLYQRMGDSTAAMKDLRRATKLMPRYARAHRHLGFRLRENGDYKSAMASFKRAIALEPKNAANYDELGWTLVKDKKPKEALPYFDTALKISPDTQLYWNDLAEAQIFLGSYGKAELASDRALKLGPNDHRANSCKAEAVLNQKHYLEAIRFADQALSEKPKCSRCLRIRAIALMKRGKLDEAERDFEKAAEYSSSSAGEALKLRSELAARRGEYELMIAYDRLASGSVAVPRERELEREIGSYSNIIKVAPGDGSAYYDRAILLFATGQSARAVADLKKFLELSRWRGKAAGYAAGLLSLALVELGRNEEAKNTLTVARRKLEAGNELSTIRYLKGEISEELFLSRVKGKEDSLRARLFVALNQLNRGHKAKAKRHLEWIKANGDPTLDEYVLAVMRLRKMLI